MFKKLHKTPKFNACLYLVEVQKMSNSIAHDKDIFETNGYNRGISTIMVSLCSFLVAGFANDNEAALEMIPIYQRQLLKEGISKEDYNNLNERIKYYYDDYRSASIIIQESNNDWLPVLLQVLAERTARNLGIENTSTSNQALQEYFVTFITRIKNYKQLKKANEVMARLMLED